MCIDQHQAREDQRKRIDALADEAIRTGVTHGAEGAELGKQVIALSTSGLFADEPYVLGKARGLRAVFESLAPIGRHAEAIQAASELLNWIKEHPEIESYTTYALAVLGHVAIFMGETKRALDYLAKATPMAEEAGDDQHHALCLELIGITHTESGNANKGIPFLRRALILRRRVGDPIGIAYSLNNIAMAEINRGHPEIAVEYAQDCGAVIREHGIPVLLSPMLDTLAQAHIGLGNREQAIAYLEQARAAASEEEDPMGSGVAQLSLGRLLCEEDETRHEGLDHLRRAMGIFERSEALPYLAACHLEISKALENEGNLPAAMEHLKIHHKLELRLSEERADQRVEVLQVMHENPVRSD